MNLRAGLYEQLITESIARELQGLDHRHSALRQSLDPEEAPDRIALHLGALIRRAVSSLSHAQRTAVGLQLARDAVDLLCATTEAIDEGDKPLSEGDVLQAISTLQPDGSTPRPPLPATPLLDTTLLTNAPGEPRIGHQLLSEVPSADRIDVLMAFVRQSGIRPLMESLRAHTEAGRRLRVLTTTYTNSTELAALLALQALGAEIRVSYDASSTRLHAKAWLFHRHSGFATAYIGSSNLTHSAQVSGLEWNVRVSGARNPDVIDKFSAVFESYWQHEDFRAFDADEFRELTQSESSGPRVYLSPVEIRPEPFQSRLLEQIELARLQGRHRNLLVSATGTGKTVMAALDYQRLRKRLARSRLLFVAHRQEILEQSLATFRHALRDIGFGELWVGGQRPARFEHVFASIQSLTATGLDNIDATHFDVVIIDEFHHAAARSYEALLKHLLPIELLGLTATPERGDQEPILHWFGNRIAAELRLWDAIDQQRLCPFVYYGISDGVDYRKVSWRRGRGYDPNELSQLVTGDTVVARRIIANLLRVVADAETMRALGFCVSVAHARFMAAQFSNAGIASLAVSADTSDEDRRQALQDLATGKLRVVFSVDLFNEGIDIPTVDTLLLLRPTDSPTVFLQQLGRGLRREIGKTVCTVLDFVGHHRSEFRFYRRFSALLGGSRKELMRQIEAGFPFLPSGCHMQLDAVATREVLDNIRSSLPSTWRAKAQELSRVAEGRSDVTLKRFLDESGLALEDIYSNNHSWSDLLESGGLAIFPNGPHEATLRRGLGRLLHVDDPERIEQYRAWANLNRAPDWDALAPRQRRLLHMLTAVLCESVRPQPATITGAAALLWQHPQVMAELGDLADVLADRIDHVSLPLDTHPDVPLAIHCRYTRREILAAFHTSGDFALPDWREGVRWLSEHQVDLLAITFDKSSEHFSPTTRYRDYAISPTLLHWESQSTTRADSPTGSRYQQHLPDVPSRALPFARLTTKDTFWFLGPATYVSHEGERPMAVTWRLEQSLPGDLHAKFAAAVG